MKVAASVFGRTGARYVAVAAVTLLLGAGGCNLEKQRSAPLVGPAETGISVQLIAFPDVVNADGVSQAVVELRLKDQDGAPAAGRAVEFEYDGDGQLVPSTDSTYVGPIQSGIVMATYQAGVARVVWVAGHQIRTVTVYVRPYGTDSQNANSFYRSVEILQQ
jgi:hypothetical protein